MTLKDVGTVVPVIISGGSGSRLWPLSRDSHPKPFIKLPDGINLLQKTFNRCVQIPDISEIVVVTKQDLLLHTHSEYLATKGKVKNSYILESISRGTGPAIAAAALAINKTHHENTILIILPADHLIQSDDEFTKTIKKAIVLAKNHSIVTIGIKPSSPETGYGYLELNKSQLHTSYYDDQNNLQSISCWEVNKFSEKPELEVAKRYVTSGNYLWNSGIFVFSIKAILQELQQVAPDIYSTVNSCISNSEYKHTKDYGYLTLNSDFFSLAPEISIDYGVIEKSTNVLTLAAEFQWNDIGSWSSMSELTEADDKGNRVHGKGRFHEARDCYIYSKKRFISAVGVENLAIIDTEDALLVLNKNSAQAVKELVHELKSEGDEIVKFHHEVHRPWGMFNVVAENNGFKVKLITVKPGASLSLQMHYHRSEHWIVVSGTAWVTKGQQQFEIRKNESTYILPGEKHRLTNLGTTDLVLVEVQCGDKLDEDDIVRFADDYGRVTA